MASSVRKKVNKYLCRILLFYGSSHRRCSAKKVFLKTLKNSHENTCVGVSLQVFRSANLFKGDQNLCFAVNIAKLLRTLQTTASYFMIKIRHSWRLNNNNKKFLNQWKSKENAYKSKQMPGGKLSRLVEAKFNFHM